MRPCPRFQGKLYGAFLAGEEKNPINFLSGLVSVKTNQEEEEEKTSLQHSQAVKIHGVAEDYKNTNYNTTDDLFPFLSSSTGRNGKGNVL